MKKFVKPAVFVLILCVVASLFCTRSATPLSANAISLQEQSWLSHLRPTSIPVPRGRDSYPAELLVSVSNQKEIKLKGTCSLEGKLTDDDVLDAIKKAASEAGYKSPENAVDDKLKIDSLKSKLSFTPEEGLVRVRAVVSCAEPVVNPDLLTAAVEQNLPSAAPDAGHFRRLALLRAGGSPYR